MPAMAIEPSGILVELLCGHPEQKYGVRSTGAGAPGGGTLPSKRAKASVTSEAPSRAIRELSALATMAGVSSPVAGMSEYPASSVLPTMRSGRFARWKAMSLSWVSTSARFSSTTMTSSSPSRNARAPSSSSGQLMPTFQRRSPSVCARAASMPRTSRASRTSA